jgi:glutathione peroxidase-family protein
MYVIMIGFSFFGSPPKTVLLKTKNKTVTIIVNVASQCGYTESHYRGLVNLWSKVKDESVEILAFPCNQFGYQEPESDASIFQFAKTKGVEFTMMSKVNVNGPTASLVYKYLKKEAGPAAITWNFGMSSFFVCLEVCLFDPAFKRSHTLLYAYNTSALHHL